MNGLVALLTDDQGLATACSHPLDPGRFLAPSWSIQVRQLADVVDLTGPHGTSANLAIECIVEKFSVRVDVTKQFPFLVTKLSPYFDR
jgi:hypothetical protein